MKKLILICIFLFLSTNAYAWDDTWTNLGPGTDWPETQAKINTGMTDQYNNSQEDIQDNCVGDTAIQTIAKDGTVTCVSASGSSDAPDVNLVGYVKPGSTSAIGATDDVQTAIGKLEAGLDTAGETNVQSDWTMLDGGDDSYILNKPSIPSGNAIIDWTLSGQGSIHNTNYNDTQLSDIDISNFGYIKTYTETDPIFLAWDKDYEDITSKPDLTLKADKNNVLELNNTSAYTPSLDYHPATFKYVNDSVSAAGGGDMLKTVYDKDDNGIVDSSESVLGEARKGSIGTITIGQPVYQSGYNPSGYVEIELADASSSATMPSLGLAIENIDNTALAGIMTLGLLENVPTDMWSVNDSLYISTTTGMLTNVRPVNDTDVIQLVGTVVKVHASEGAIFVNGFTRVNDVPNNIEAQYIDSDIARVSQIPTNNNQLTNGALYLTSYNETDPLFTNWDRSYTSLIDQPSIPNVSDLIYGIGWESNLDAPSKNSVYDKIEGLNLGIQHSTSDGNTYGSKDGAWSRIDYVNLLNLPSIPSVSDNVYGVGWNANTDAATKNTIYAKIESLAGGHDPVTLGTPNGLSLTDQELSLALATTGVSGSMSFTDKGKLDNIELLAKDDQIASEVPYTPIGDVSSANTQDAIYEVSEDSKSGIETLTNKTLDSTTNSIGADHLHLRVKATETITEGTLVTVTGYNSGEDALEIAIPTSQSDLIAGITHYTINIGEFGGIQNIGIYEGLDTSAYATEDELYSDGLGGFTNTKPSGDYQRLAYVLKNHAVNGSIYISAEAPLVVPEDVLYGASWDSNLLSATKNSVYDKVELMTTDISNLETLSGVFGNTDLGAFAGTIISDNVDTKGALQELEIEVGLNTDKRVPDATDGQVLQSNGVNNYESVDSIAISGIDVPLASDYKVDGVALDTGVMALTEGTNITITGTATNPIINTGAGGSTQVELSTGVAPDPGEYDADTLIKDTASGDMFYQSGTGLYTIAGEYEADWVYHTLTITPPASADGTVTCTDTDLATEINCDDGVVNNACSSLVLVDASITGLASTGDFDTWTGDITSSENPTTTALVMSSDKTVGVDYAVCSFESQDLTTYTETDPGGDITVTATTVSWNVMLNDVQNMVTKDFVAAPFNGDFTVQYETTITATSTYGGTELFAVANVDTGLRPVGDGGGDYLGFRFYSNGGSDEFLLRSVENGVTNSDLMTGVTFGTTYYITYIRDDDAGTNGTGLLTAEIRTGSHEGTLVDTLTVNVGAGEQNDFQYMYTVDSNNAGNTHNTSGSTANFEVKQCL